jgi:hypothetical protein
LVIVTSTDCGIVSDLTETHACLTKQLEKHSTELKEIRILLKKERTGRIYVTPSLDNYYWSHGYKVTNSHTSQSCNYPKEGHKREATPRATTRVVLKQTRNNGRGDIQK